MEEVMETIIKKDKAINGLKIIDSILSEKREKKTISLSYPKDWHESWGDNWQDSHRP